MRCGSRRGAITRACFAVMCTLVSTYPTVICTHVIYNFCLARNPVSHNQEGGQVVRGDGSYHGAGEADTGPATDRRRCAFPSSSISREDNPSRVGDSGSWILSGALIPAPVGSWHPASAWIWLPAVALGLLPASIRSRLTGASLWDKFWSVR